jgi:hypothetical protein
LLLGSIAAATPIPRRKRKICIARPMLAAPFLFIAARRTLAIGVGAGCRRGGKVCGLACRHPSTPHIAAVVTTVANRNFRKETKAAIGSCRCASGEEGVSAPGVGTRCTISKPHTCPLILHTDPLSTDGASHYIVWARALGGLLYLWGMHQGAKNCLFLESSPRGALAAGAGRDWPWDCLRMSRLPGWRCGPSRLVL